MNTEDIRVSVVIPVYNVEKYLRECVDSVLAQTHRCLEVILVDDGSPDRCGEICDEYAAADSRVTVIHQQNGGLSAARNTGMAAARGRYIMFLDSDDYIACDAVEALTAYAEKNRTDIVLFDADIYYDGFDGRSFHNSYERDRTYPAASGAAMLRRLSESGEYSSCVPLQFFRTGLLKANGLCFYKGIIHEDELFTPVALVKAERVGHVRKMLYIRRQRNDSIMSSRESIKGFRGMYICLRELLRAAGQYPDGSPEKDALLLRTAEIANQTVIRYADLTAEERKKASAGFSRLCRCIRAYKYLGSRKLRVKLLTMPLYLRYRALKNARSRMAEG